MNAALHETQMTCYEETFSGQKQIEISGESVVSDRMPDIGLLGDTDTHVFLRSKRVQAGVGIMEGDMTAGVCYIPDGAGGLRMLELSIPWQVQFEGEGLSDDGVIVGKVTVCALETRMLNPRKVLVKARLQASFHCYEKHTVTVCDDVESDPRIQVRQEETECSMIAAVCEKTFVAADEYPLSEDLAGGEVLEKSVQFRVDDVKTLMNKLIIKGSALTEAVIATESGHAEKISFTCGFSFIAETDCEAVPADVKVTVMPTALYADIASGGNTLNLEAHGVCQMVAYRKQKLNYLSDAFSNFMETRQEHRTVTVYREGKSGLQRESVGGELACRGQVARVRFMTASPMAPNYVGGMAQVPVVISACVQYESGGLDWVKRQETVQFKLKDNEQLLSVRTGELHGLATGTGVEYRLTMDGEVREEVKETLQTLSGIDMDEDSPITADRPSVTVVRACGSLWDLARQYGSTVPLIRQYNEIEEEEVTARRLLLIPKQHQP